MTSAPRGPVAASAAAPPPGAPPPGAPPAPPRPPAAPPAPPGARRRRIRWLAVAANVNDCMSCHDCTAPVARLRLHPPRLRGGRVRSGSSLTGRRRATRGRRATATASAPATTPAAASGWIDLIRDPLRVGRERRSARVGDLEIGVRVQPEDVQHRLRVGGRRVGLRQYVGHPLAVAGDRLAVDGAPSRVVLDAQRFLGLREGECRRREEPERSDVGNAGSWGSIHVVHGPSS